MKMFEINKSNQMQRVCINANADSNTIGFTSALLYFFTSPIISKTIGFTSLLLYSFTSSLPHTQQDSKEYD